jgi:hypothetical protein
MKLKRFAMIMLAVATLFGGIDVASAQRGGGSHGGAAASGGSHGGSGGSWHGGGGNWNGGSHGGNWNGGSHGGNWHGGHSNFVVGVGFGWPYWGGWGWWPGYYYGGYYPYYPAYNAYPYTYEPYSYDTYPTGTYIQRDAPAAGPARNDYSYYCPDPAGYYPDVRTCAKGWLRVVPQNAPGPTGPTSY